jgi:predicted ATPase
VTTPPDRAAGTYVFLSYASADRERALRIADLLEAHGTSVWIDRKSIAGGTSWGGEIVRGIRGCSFFLVVCSPAAMTSPNVLQEIQVAFESRHPILPLLLQPVQMPESVVYALAGRQWIEVLDRPEERWLTEALRALREPSVPAASTGSGASSTPLSAAQPSTPPEAAPARHNLPVEVTSFVGRERELAEIRGLLASTHLLTLTGTGGCGKTRLAVKLGETVLADFVDGVWLVELAPLAEPSLIPHFVATAVGVREIAGRDLTPVLVDGLRARHLLLILDNCEHLISDCAQIAETLLRGCPHLRIVATSREILGASGETVWRVPSLPVPDPRQLPSDSAERVDLVGSSEAVRLFVERARQVVSDFRVTPGNATVLAEICFRIDGIPLAIELAASRLRTISVEQIAARLDSSFRLLTGGSRTALRRQQTLQALIDWSYDLLAREEQAFFRKLSVFVGGWQLEAAGAVGAGEGRTGDVLDLLAALADKSLVAVETTTGHAPRYRLLETLREYALERLVASGDAETIHTAHATYYLALAEHLRLDQRDQWDYVHTGFVEELDNFRAALRWFADTDGWDGCVRLVGSLGTYWYGAGFLDESSQWLEQALQHATDVPLAKRGRVLEGLGGLAFARGEFTTAESILRESIRLGQDQGNPREVSRALETLGALLRDRAELGAALPVLQESLRLGREVGDQWRVSAALFQLGLLARQQGDFQQAEELLGECLRVSRSVDSLPGFEGMIYYNLGLAAEDQGDLPRARSLYCESIPLARASGFRWIFPYVLEGFVTLAARKGQAERAMVLAGAAATVRQHSGNPIPPAMKPRLDQAIARARQDLGAAADDAWARGQAMTLEQAIEYALEGEGSQS